MQKKNDQKYDEILNFEGQDERQYSQFINQRGNRNLNQSSSQNQIENRNQNEQIFEIQEQTGSYLINNDLNYLNEGQYEEADQSEAQSRVPLSLNQLEIFSNEDKSIKSKSSSVKFGIRSKKSGSKSKSAKRDHLNQSQKIQKDLNDQNNDIFDVRNFRQSAPQDQLNQLQKFLKEDINNEQNHIDEQQVSFQKDRQNNQDSFKNNSNLEKLQSNLQKQYQALLLKNSSSQSQMRDQENIQQRFDGSKLSSLNEIGEAEKNISYNNESKQISYEDQLNQTKYFNLQKVSNNNDSFQMNQDSYGQQQQSIQNLMLQNSQQNKENQVLNGQASEQILEQSENELKTIFQRIQNLRKSLNQKFTSPSLQNNFQITYNREPNLPSSNTNMKYSNDLSYSETNPNSQYYSKIMHKKFDFSPQQCITNERMNVNDLLSNHQHFKFQTASTTQFLPQNLKSDPFTNQKDFNNDFKTFGEKNSLNQKYLNADFKSSGKKKESENNYTLRAGQLLQSDAFRSISDDQLAKNKSASKKESTYKKFIAKQQQAFQNVNGQTHQINQKLINIPVVVKGMLKQTNLGGGMRSYSNSLLKTEGREAVRGDQDILAFKKGILHPEQEEINRNNSAESLNQKKSKSKSKSSYKRMGNKSAGGSGHLRNRIELKSASQPLTKVEELQKQKLEEYSQLMDQMQKKILKFQNKEKFDMKQAQMYNDLLIKFNSLLYKYNTQQNRIKGIEDVKIEPEQNIVTPTNIQLKSNNVKKEESASKSDIYVKSSIVAAPVSEHNISVSADNLMKLSKKNISQLDYHSLRMKSSKKQNKSQLNSSDPSNLYQITDNDNIVSQSPAPQQEDQHHFLIKKQQSYTKNKADEINTFAPLENININQQHSQIGSLNINNDKELQSLQEEIKKLNAQKNFYKTKYLQAKNSLQNYKKMQNIIPTNWASSHGTMHLATNSYLKAKRSNSANTTNIQLHPYISPALKPQLESQKKSFSRNSTSKKPYVNIYQTQQKEDLYKKLVSEIGPMKLLDNFQCASKSVKNIKPGKESVTPIELHRKIFNLERVLGQQRETIINLKNKLYQYQQQNFQKQQMENKNDDLDELGISQKDEEKTKYINRLPCCCSEIQEINTEKQKQLMGVSEFWRQKVQVNIKEHQEKLQKLKSQQINLYQSAHFEIKQMKTYLESVIKNILKKQEDTVKIYEGKLNAQKKENKSLIRRIIQGRNVQTIKSN